ncbi:MAG: T9SS C-terminal target domain-containing protein [Ignavibacteriae bacterium]|nr:MAG: T9SS C-terminal target domain-containing protein [Ignavibacteriota bacterium]
MKKLYFLFYLVLISFLLIGSSYAGDRMVLVERFTSSTCPPCASNNPIMDAFLSAQDPDKIVGISYHMNWPAPGNDPFYLHNPGDNNIRRTYYNVNSIPQARMDGIIDIQPTYNPSTLLANLNSRTSILSPVTIIVQDTVVGDSILIKVTVFCETSISNPNAVLQIAVIEKFKQFSTPPGTNGETVFHDIMRRMEPSGNGTPIFLLPGQVTVIQKSVYMNHEWQANQMRVMVFIQDNATKEILNAAIKTANFTLLPSPGFKVVQQGQSQNASYKIKLPSIAPGYNSPITLTAALEPPVNGVTVSFPSGNVFNNFSDSITLQVSSTSSVPSGEYRVVVTGTNTNNKVHKTSVIYLVGKNYITTGCNRMSLQYKVDNVTYTGSKFFVWDVNSVHNLAAVSPQLLGTTTRYLFQSWSHGGDSVQNITVNTNPANYIINYKVQYKLVTSNIPAVNVNIIGGNVFYDSSATAGLSLSALQVQYNNMTYYFQRWQGSGNGSYTGTNPTPQLVMNNVLIENAVWDTIAPIGIGKISNEIPVTYSLFQNYPNPFNPVTTIKYALPKDAELSLKVYDVLGNEVAVLFNGFRRAGYYEDVFDASGIASGIYFYKLISKDFTDIKKMILIK